MSAIRSLIFDSHYKTDQYHQIMRKSAGGYVFVNYRLMKRFQNQSICLPILDISDRAFRVWVSRNGALTLHRAKKWAYQFDAQFPVSLVNVIASDRRLSEIAFLDAIQYLFFISEKIVKFVNENTFTHALMEPTWAHEILSAMLLEKHGVIVFQIQKCKLRPDHFYLFKGIYDLEFWANNVTQPVPLDSIITDSQSLGIKGFNRDSCRNSSITWLGRRLVQVVREKMTGEHNGFIHEKFFRTVIRKCCSVIRFYLITTFSSAFGFSSSPRTDYFVYFPLHYEPEAAILVNGREFRDQLGTLCWLREVLPANCELVVKEHPHCVGNRPIDFYRKLLSIPGEGRLTLLRPSIASRELIAESQGVIAIAGTAVLEGYLMGKPGFCLVPMYFAKLWPWSADKIGDQVDVMLKLDGRFDLKLEALELVCKGAFLGNTDDRLLSPSSVSRQNVELMARQIHEALKS